MNNILNQNVTFSVGTVILVIIILLLGNAFLQLLMRFFFSERRKLNDELRLIEGQKENLNSIIEIRVKEEVKKHQMHSLTVSRLAQFLDDYWHNNETKEHILSLISMMFPMDSNANLLSKVRSGYLTYNDRIITLFGEEYGIFIMKNFTVHDCLELISNLSQHPNSDSDMSVDNFIDVIFKHKVYPNFEKLNSQND